MGLMSCALHSINAIGQLHVSCISIKYIYVITFQSDWGWDSQFLEIGSIELGISFGYIKPLVCRRSKKDPCEFFDESFSSNSKILLRTLCCPSLKTIVSDSRPSFEIIDTSFVYVTSYIISLINTYFWIFFELCCCKFFL